MDLERVVADARKELHQCVVCMNVALIDRNQAATLTRFLVTGTADFLDGVILQFMVDEVGYFRQRQEQAYSTFYAPCAVALTQVPGPPATSICCNVEKGGDERELKLMGNSSGQTIRELKTHLALVNLLIADLLIVNMFCSRSCSFLFFCLGKVLSK